MSQAGIVDVEGSHPQIPTMFVTDSGTAIPIANVLEILATTVAQYGTPLRTTGSGNTVTIVGQYTTANASSVAGKAGLASFNSAQFSVDANGFVTLAGSAAFESIQVDTFTAPGTNPVVPNGSGVLTVTGGQVAAGTTVNVIRTDSLAANTYTIEIQRSQAVGSSTIGDNGVSHFNSSFFTVDANGFVSLNGAGVGETITGNTGGALSPTAGNWNILGTSTAAGAIPVQTSGTGSTLTVQVQKSQAIASTDATKVGLANFNSSFFTVDGNGFVSINGSGVGETITGTTGGALSPTAGNWNILASSTAAGTTPIQTSGSVSTLTIQVQKAQAIASTNATNVGLAAFNSAQFTVDGNGFVSINGSGVAETITGNSGGALSPTSGNWNILGTGSITTSGSVSTLTVQLTGLTNHAVQVGAGTATLTQVGPSATVGAVLASNGASSDPSFQTIASLGGITSITGNSGGAEVPLNGNFNILGTGSITVAGSANTETVQLTGLTNHSLLVGAGTPTITSLGVATNGQLPIGSAGADPVLATLTAGAGISIANGAGSITISSTGSFTWTDEATNFNAVSGNGYFVTATATATLPASPSQGDQISFIVDSASGILTIKANTGQFLRLGNVISASAGTCVSSLNGDSIVFVYRASDTTWIALSGPQGFWTVT